jgi:hypothetical protein
MDQSFSNGGVVSCILDIRNDNDVIGVVKLYLALPQNLWVKGSNISRMEAFGFFAFPR